MNDTMVILFPNSKMKNRLPRTTNWADKKWISEPCFADGWEACDSTMPLNELQSERLRKHRLVPFLCLLRLVDFLSLGTHSYHCKKIQLTVRKQDTLGMNYPRIVVMSLHN